MTTQTHKWLPSEPTDEMVNTAYHTWKHIAHPSILSAIRAMLKAAMQATPKREPLDDETILGIARTIPNLSGDDSALIQFARELGA
jgi:hypothetical protein